MTYGIKWTQWKKPAWKGATLADATETVEMSRTFSSEGARDKFLRQLQDKDSFVTFTDFWAEG